MDMARAATVFDEAAFATLEPGEIDEAINAGGIAGVIAAIVARSPGLDPSIVEAVGGATSWPPVRRCRDALSNHQQEPAIDHADSLEYVTRQHAAVALVAAALLDAGMWLARSPGRVVPDHNVAGGMKRTFSRP